MCRFLPKFELYSLRAPKPAALALRAMLRQRRNARGATFAASLTSELADSALLGYLRPACFASCGAGAANLSLRQKKEQSKRTALFWRRRRDLNSRAGKTDLHP